MRATVTTFLIAMLLAIPAAAERLNDKDVKALLERVDHDRDRFEDQLDGKLKHNILRGPGGEVDVEKYLDDLQENVDRLKDRFTASYAASAEATTVLRQGSDVQRYVVTLPPNFEGASEWNRLASSLEALAAAYGTKFPIADGESARRINDLELQQAAEGVAKAADEFKKELSSSLKDDKSVDKAPREASLKEVEALKKDAKTLASRVGDGHPASVEAKELLDRAAAVQASSSARPLSPAAQAAWASVQSGLAKVAQGFGMPVRPGKTTP